MITYSRTAVMITYSHTAVVITYSRTAVMITHKCCKIMLRIDLYFCQNPINVNSNLKQTA